MDVHNQDQLIDSIKLVTGSYSLLQFSDLIQLQWAGIFSGTNTIFFYRSGIFYLTVLKVSAGDSLLTKKWFKQVSFFHFLQGRLWLNSFLLPWLTLRFRGLKYWLEQNVSMKEHAILNTPMPPPRIFQVTGQRPTTLLYPESWNMFPLQDSVFWCKAFINRH